MSAQLVRCVRYSMSVVLAAVVAGGLSGCAEETDPGVPQKPFVEITSDPLEGGTVSYAIRIHWDGWDPDGFLSRFEYAVDPPSAFTEPEIEGKGDVTAETIQGQNDNPDVTRISKVVNGETVSFDWVHTIEHSRLFRFATPQADSTDENGQLIPTGRFSGMHAVYVRGVDTDGLYSDPDRVAFTAETVAPSSEIIRPRIGSEITNMGPRTILGWTGNDPDGTDPEQRPVRFIYKLLRLDTLNPQIPLSQVSIPQILLDKGDPNWPDLPPDQSSMEIEFNDLPGQYVFGIRAIDEAGAIEPFLEFGRNAFKFQAFETGGRPTLTLDCILGRFSFRGLDGHESVELPESTDLNCRVQCSASEYGEQCNEYRWGIDIPDLELDEYWTDWGTETALPPIQFSDGSIHVLYVQARDAIGTITMGTLVLNIVEFPFDRELLYVDDSFDDLYPRDGEHDEFWRTRIADYGGFSPELVGEFHAHLDNDRGALSPEVPLLEDLGRYKIVVWECRGSGYNGTTALLQATAVRPLLNSYLRAGGKLWLGGRMTVAATMVSPIELHADLIYPKEDFGPGFFAWDFLKLHSTRINNDKAKDQNGRHNIAKTIPFPGRPEIYPVMDVDINKLNPAAQDRGVSHADAVFDPIFAHSEPEFAGVIDSLYTYGSTAVHLMEPPSSSTYENRLTAIRWHDPDPAREHGRIQWFGFPLYFFEDSQAQETCNRSMDWFQEEEIRP